MTDTDTSRRMHNVIRIDEDGTITRYTDADLLGLAGEHFDGMTSTFTCQPIDSDEARSMGYPCFTQPLIGVCHDLAYFQPDATVNPKAWALYGRSPIAGPAYVARVDHEPFDDAWLEQLAADFVQGPAMRVGEMRRLAMDNGLMWPVAA